MTRDESTFLDSQIHRCEAHFANFGEYDRSLIAEIVLESMEFGRWQMATAVIEKVNSETTSGYTIG